MVTYFSVQYRFIAMCITYGVTLDIGNKIVYTVPLQTSMKVSIIECVFYFVISMLKLKWSHFAIVCLIIINGISGSTCNYELLQIRVRDVLEEHM